MAKYLIAGGAGFIGSHLAETLVASEQDVVILDNLASDKRENLLPASQGPGRLNFVEGDMRDLAICRQVMQGVDFVLHQAARPSVQRSMEAPLLSHDINLTGTTNLLVATKGAGVKHFVSASSSSVYGDREDPAAPKREDMDPRPKSPYATKKVAMEFYCQAFHRAYGLETVMLRYCNVFGLRQDPDSPYAAVIPKFLFALMQGQSPPVHGYGRHSRDFIYISNVVAANLANLGTAKAAILSYKLDVGFEQGLAILVDLAQRGRYLA